MGRILCLLILWWAWQAPAFAERDGLTPVGLWRVIGDKTGEAEALVRIAENNGVYEGRIVSIFPRADIDPNARCEACPGSRKDQPVKGLLILSGIRLAGGIYQGGEILDPDSGEIYRCSLSLSEDRRRLFVRGYIGISLFGRTQTWIRE